MPLAPRFWYQESSPYAYWLRPFSWLYKSLVIARRICYQIGLKKTIKFSVPIVVVGNITVGGTGKTPFVIGLTNWLKEQGFHPGIVSRGYGGKQSNLKVVTATSDPHRVGDEAVLIVKKTNCPMVVCSDRPLAVKKLLMDYDCDIIVSDDGLQHYALGRNIEIAMVDSDRLFGNRFCLPAGPLREPMSRLKTVDFMVMHGETTQKNSMQLRHTALYQLKNPNNFFPMEVLKNKVIHAVAGIGAPHRFFQQLEKLDATVMAHPFPDHHRYQPSDFNFGDEAMIVMTEKDAVKCQSFDDQRLWCVTAEAVLSPEFLLRFQRRLELFN